jgi:hypothetical protein
MSREDMFQLSSAERTRRVVFTGLVIVVLVLAYHGFSVQEKASVVFSSADTFVTCCTKNLRSMLRACQECLQQNRRRVEAAFNAVSSVEAKLPALSGPSQHSVGGSVPPPSFD